MKKIILVVSVLASGFALRAQTTAVYTVQSGGSDNAYIVSQPLHANFQTTYPGTTMATWEPMNGWWYSTYKEDNNMITYSYYSTQPYYLLKDRDVNYKVTLPVINTYVPETVIATAINNFGASLYSITTIMSPNNDLLYQVGLMENGTLRTVCMNPERTVFTSMDKMRVGDLKDKKNEEK